MKVRRHSEHRARARAIARAGMHIVHAGDCSCRPHQFFRCAECQRLVGYCQGGHEGDERLDALCCDCWVKATHGKAAG